MNLMIIRVHHLHCDGFRVSLPAKRCTANLGEATPKEKALLRAIHAQTLVFDSLAADRSKKLLLTKMICW